MASFETDDIRLGDLMRGERATKGKTLLDIQRETGIKALHIAAIENADPDTISNQPKVDEYVSAYAEYLGLDPHWAREKFWQEIPIPYPTHEALTNETVWHQKEKRGPDPGAIASVIVLIALIGSILFGSISVLIEIWPELERPTFATPELVSLVYTIFAVWIGYRLLFLARHFDFLLILLLVFFVPIAFSGAYWVQEPACLVNADSFADFVYFSYITYTSVGFGDISPVGNCRMLAVAQGIVGAFGLAVAAGLLLMVMRRS